jgi:general secretion pathway protein M
MIARLSSWWAGRSQREQIMLGVLSAILVAMIIWLILARVLAPAVAAAEERHRASVTALGEARAQAAALAFLRKNPPPPLGAPVTDVVRAAAAETGFPLSRADPVGGDGIIISIVSAKSPAFFEWVQNLQRRGVFIDQLSVRTNPDSTIAVDAQFRARVS